MKQAVTKYMFIDAFKAIRPDNFSYEALSAMFEYFEQLEEDTGEEMELDVISICCDFGEYTLKEINQDYDQEFETLEEAIDWLNDQTTVIPVNDETVVFAGF